MFTLGREAILWKSAKQTCMTRSTMEAKFITLELVGQEAEWLKGLLAIYAHMGEIAYGYIPSL